MVLTQIPVIQFGRDRYHLQGDMERWCRQNIGPGQWTCGELNTWKGMTDRQWIIWSMFGSTFFQFRQESDAVLFALKWQ
jgi:hypothetical protein